MIVSLIDKPEAGQITETKRYCKATFDLTEIFKLEPKSDGARKAKKT